MGSPQVDLCSFPLFGFKEDTDAGIAGFSMSPTSCNLLVSNESTTSDQKREHTRGTSADWPLKDESGRTNRGFPGRPGDSAEVVQGALLEVQWEGVLSPHPETRGRA